MTHTLTSRILAQHLVAGDMTPGFEIAIAIDQTLTQDTTGTMAWLQFEAMDPPRVATRLSVSYVDQTALQPDFRNPDGHRYLQTVAAKCGALFSRPGNGSCHQVHLERFGAHGKTLLGYDSHTPNAGALGMLALGAGGLDVAAAMSVSPFELTMPRIVGVRFAGQLGPWASAKDVILKLLHRSIVKVDVDQTIENRGAGVGMGQAPLTGAVSLVPAARRIPSHRARITTNFAVLG